jgi:ATP/maltotriose-dependent transcriptional regulator MalT
VTTTLLILAQIAMNTGSSEVPTLLQESAAMVQSGDDLWGRARVLTLQALEAFRALDLDLARDLSTASHAIAVRLGDRAAQAENLLALAHNHLIRGEGEDAAGALDQTRALAEQLDDPHQMVHVDEGLALLAVSRGEAAEGAALLEDVTRRILKMDRVAMGSAYALGLADVYHRADRPDLAAAMLRHALSMLDENRNPELYQRARDQLSTLEAGAAEPPNARTSGVP